MPERDLFANFDRMRREMDELFGDVLQRSGLARATGGFSPAVDVYYCGDPPMAIVEAELAGIDTADIGLERRRAYQQLEIGRGPFRRVVSLGADVVADEARAVYEDGILRVELPLARPERRTRTVPVETGRGARDA